MSTDSRSVLVIGESGVGKTCYGAQLLKRLNKGDCGLGMKGAASNLGPFEAAMVALDEGLATGHTAPSSYVESVWPIVDSQGREAQLVWPDYGGEQVRRIVTSRRLSGPWRSRIAGTSAWLLLIRLHHSHVSDDVFSRPLGRIGEAGNDASGAVLSDQARLVELLQILLYAWRTGNDNPETLPRLTVLLTCWDETGLDSPPGEALRSRLSMFHDFLMSNWESPGILGLSALGRSLGPENRDMEYAARGPEQFGYVVLPDGTKEADLTIPITTLLAGVGWGL